jgi:hypothetical protein
MSANYTMITVAACEPGYTQEALGHVETLAEELKDEADCITACSMCTLAHPPIRL